VRTVFDYLIVISCVSYCHNNW